MTLRIVFVLVPIALLVGPSASAQDRRPRLLERELRLPQNAHETHAFDAERPPRARPRYARTRRTAARWFTMLGSGMALASSTSLLTWGRASSCSRGPERTTRRLAAASLGLGLTMAIVGAIRMARRAHGSRRREIVRTAFGSLLFAGLHFGTLSLASFGILFCST